MSDNIEVFLEICREGAKIPYYANSGDAGMDVCSAEDVLINPGQTVIIPTGLKMAIPEGFEIQVRPRSGISFKTPLLISNSPGTIDSGFRDEIGIIMSNLSQNEEKPGAILNLSDSGNKKGIYKINKGERIAQLVLQRVPKMKLTLVDSVKNIGIDRKGGFGSTGIE